MYAEGGPSDFGELSRAVAPLRGVLNGVKVLSASTFWAASVTRPKIVATGRAQPALAPATGSDFTP